MTAPVKFTPQAHKKIKELVASLRIGQDQYLRIGVKGGGGCGGVAHLLAFDHKTDQDEEYVVDQIRVIIRKGQSMYILGMEIDYEEDGNSKGFVFRSNSGN
jgi:iron-sulfur cluster assembly protein